MSALVGAQRAGLACACCPPLPVNPADFPPPRNVPVPRARRDAEDGGGGDAAVGSSVCKHFARGRCRLGAGCGLVHFPPPPEPPPGAPRSNPGSKSSRTRNKGRAAAFHVWLLERFGVDVLRRGAGVLDVAGGAGELSFLLVNLSGVRSTVVDPRPLSLEDFARRYYAGWLHRGEPSGQKQPALAPGHAPCFFDNALWRSALYGDGEGPNAIVDGEGASLPTWEEVRSLLRNCSAVVGMHVDAAAGAMIDYALAAHKPFAIVACCVFWKQFPQRRLLDGTAVRSYDDLVQWLAGKDPRIEVDTLDFLGRNKVVYLVQPEASA